MSSLLLSLPTMPKEMTHIVLAEEACQVLGNTSPRHNKGRREIATLLREQRNAYYFGSVAPDIFFYDIAFPLENKKCPRGGDWGNAIHGTRGENTMAHIFAMAHILNESRLQASLGYRNGMPEKHRKLCLAFAMGYLTHVALDTVLHPIVYYFSGNYYAPEPTAKKWSETRHRTIESLLDLLVLERTHRTFTELNTPVLVKMSAKQQKVVLGFFTLALRMAFGNESTPAIPGDRWFQPRDNIYTDPLYKTVKRGTIKQRILNRLFRIRVAGKSALLLNRKNRDKFSEFSTLMYPARTYTAYLKKWRNPLDLYALQHFRNPLTNQEKKISFADLSKRSLARCRRYLVAFDRLVNHLEQEAALKKILNGPSLNNARPGVPTKEMQFFAPLPLNGNFEIVQRT